MSTLRGGSEQRCYVDSTTSKTKSLLKLSLNSGIAESSFLLDDIALSEYQIGFLFLEKRLIFIDMGRFWVVRISKTK